jgi:hypothetical protein
MSSPCFRRPPRPRSWRKVSVSMRQPGIHFPINCDMIRSLEKDGPEGPPSWWSDYPPGHGGRRKWVQTCSCFPNRHRRYSRTSTVLSSLWCQSSSCIRFHHPSRSRLPRLVSRHDRLVGSAIWRIAVFWRAKYDSTARSSQSAGLHSVWIGTAMSVTL